MPKPKGNGELEERPAREAPLSACGNCGRKFASDRLDHHFNICVNQRDTKPFNIAEKRVEGTEAEQLLKTGRLKLPPPKPVLTNSELTKKALTKDPLPPIESKDQPNGKGGGGRSTTAYRIDFESDGRIKTSKNSKFGPTPRVLGTARIMNKPDGVDDRYLSAERARTRWKSAGHAANPNLGELDEDEDEEDFLSASQASTRSDAFDFLFDSQNLNPEKVLEKANLETYTEEKLQEYDRNNGKNVVQNSQCCLIS